MNDCIECPKAKKRGGYAMQYVGGGRKAPRYMLKHRFVWEQENGPIPEGLQILHSCDNPACFNLKHLRLGTPADNMRDRSERGRCNSPAGERNRHAKMTEEQAICVMARLLTGRETQRTVADDLGLDPSAISHLWRGHTWTHLFQEEV